jgi:hypothetical protein
VGLKLWKKTDYLQSTNAIVGRGGPVPDEQHVGGFREFARKTIKRFSHTREKETPGQCADGRFVTRDIFALGMPMSILELVSQWIEEFSGK